MRDKSADLFVSHCPLLLADELAELLKERARQAIEDLHLLQGPDHIPLPLQNPPLEHPHEHLLRKLANQGILIHHQLVLPR